jgi:hypothetical protein
MPIHSVFIQNSVNSNIINIVLHTIWRYNIIFLVYISRKPIVLHWGNILRRTFLRLNFQKERSTYLWFPLLIFERIDYFSLSFFGEFVTIGVNWDVILNPDFKKTDVELNSIHSLKYHQIQLAWLLVDLTTPFRLHRLWNFEREMTLYLLNGSLEILWDVPVLV